MPNPKSWSWISIALILLGMIPPELSYSSDDKTDSLLQVISAHPSDREGADAMLSAVKHYKNVFMEDSAMKYTLKALELSERIGYPKGIASAKLFMCIDQWRNGLLTEAQASISEVIFLVKKLDDKPMLGKAYYHQGVIYGLTTQMDSAKYYFKASMSLVPHDTQIVISCYNGLGNNFLNTAEYDSALYYYISAARLAELSGKESNLGVIYASIGGSLRELGEFDEAAQYFYKALNISKKHNDAHSTAANMISIGGTYYLQNDFRRALDYLDSASQIFRDINETGYDAELFSKYAQINEAQKEFDKAFKNYNRALNIYKGNSDLQGMGQNYLSMGKMLTKKGDLVKAGIYLDSAMAVLKLTGYRPDLLFALLLRAQNSYTTGHFKEAYDDLEAFANLKDTIFNQDKAKIIAEMKAQYEKEKDQARILGLEKESLKRTMQRNSLFYSILAIIMIGIYGMLAFRHKLLRSRLLAEQRIQKLEEEKRLMAARNLVEGQEEERKRIAMELHDGLGVILSATKMHFSTIQAEVKNDHGIVDKAIRLIEEATGEVRRISHNMMPGLLTKLGLYDAVEDLFDNLNESGQLQANLEIEGERKRLTENSEIMVYRIIQELVNNTLKYAGAKQIGLLIKVSNPKITIHYTDDGVGFDQEKLVASGHKSLGLKSIMSRVGFLNGTLNFDTAPGKGVDYLIRIPA